MSRLLLRQWTTEFIPLFFTQYKQMDGMKREWREESEGFIERKRKREIDRIRESE